MPQNRTAVRTAVALTGLVLAMSTTGCHHHDTVDPESLPPATRVTNDDLPPAVRVAFRRDHPDAAITDLRQFSAETGAPLYRVTFIDNHTPGSATYYMNGQRLTLPSTAR